MNSAVCTLFEKDYYLGLGAWANSLYAHGYRGTIYAGCRGALPPWVTATKPADGFTEFSPAKGLTLRFIPLATTLHLTNVKPDFMLDVWEKHCPQADALFYFDPDITVKCRWTFFEEWTEAGVAVCQDVNGWMADNHPIRHAWRKLLQPEGLEFRNRFETYFNGGFVGLRASDKPFLSEWLRIQASMQKLGVDFQVIGFGDRTFPFTCRDQDALNITCMATEQKVSPLGRDGMDFANGGYIMSHAAGGTKPWRKKMLREAVLAGSMPSQADKNFYANVREPIQVFPTSTFQWRKIDLMLASAIGRYLG
jgi:hypothetical protein